MKIEFVPSAVDLVTVMKYSSNKLKSDLRPRKSMLYSILFGIPFTLLFFVPAMLFVANQPRGINLYIGYLVGILILFLFIATRLQKRRLLQNIEASLTNDSVTILLTDHGIETVSSTSTSTISWADIKDITETKDYILFDLLLYNSIYIPRRAFTSKEDIESFIKGAHNFMAAFKNQLKPDALKPRAS